MGRTRLSAIDIAESSLGVLSMCMVNTCPNQRPSLTLHVAPVGEGNLVNVAVSSQVHVPVGLHVTHVGGEAAAYVEVGLEVVVDCEVR